MARLALPFSGLIRHNAQVKRLEGLTFLRFIGVFFVVLFHALGAFDTPWIDARLSKWAVPQAISFFFVLSGFILSIVYPKFRSRDQLRDYYRHRFARIWPLHLTVLALLLLIVPLSSLNLKLGFQWSTFLPVIFLVQSWIPFRNYYFAYNGVAWTLSVECFFYLIFPWLIHRWRTTWMPKLAISIVCAGGLIVLCKVLALPPYPQAMVGEITAHSFIIINPLARLFEFVLGMIAALVYQTLRTKHIPLRIGILSEVLAFGFVAFSLRQVAFLGRFVQQLQNDYPIQKWLSANSACLSFAILIIVLALECGVIWRWLSWKPLVYLGNCSYAIYLLHQVVLQFYASHLSLFAGMNLHLLYAAYCFISLGASALLYSYVEKPCRRYLISASSVSQKDTWRGVRVLPGTVST